MTSMKKLLLELSIASLMLMGGVVYSQETEADIPVDSRIRANNVSDGDFNSADVWTQYDSGGWNDFTSTVVPWLYPSTMETWADTQVRVKMDNSTLTTSAAIGSADSLVNMTLTGLWNSTINVKYDFYITGNFWQDGNSVINISDGATVSVSQLGNTLVNVDSATYILRNGGGDNGGKLYATNGAKIYQQTGDLNMNGELDLSDSEFYGKLYFRGNDENPAIINFTNSTLNASDEGNMLTAYGKSWTATYNNSVLNNYYMGWKEGATEGSWRGNSIFFHIGGDAEQILTFENGTIVNGAGAADGTSYWAMDAETRTLDDIKDGGNVNLGWWELNENSNLTVNLLSGSKFVSKNLEFANAASTSTSYGKITWNQSGSSDAITEAVFSGDINLRLSKAETVEDGNFETTINLEGYSKFITRSNINIGSDDSQSGTANFLMSGSNNWAEFNSFYVRMGKGVEEVSTTANIDISGSNNTLYARDNFNLSESLLTTGATINFSMTGEGNVLNVNKFNVNSQDDSTGGTITAVFRGDMEAPASEVAKS